MLTIFVVGFVFALGLIVGSFMNMALARYNTGLRFNKRSFCFSCEHTLSWYDLIPLISFIIQKGRCRYCGTSISLRYPLIEFVTGVFFVLIFLKSDPSLSVYYILNTTYYILIFSILFAIVVYDIRHKIIPDGLVYLFIIFTLLNALGVLNLEFGVWNLFGNWKLPAPLFADGLGEIGNLLAGPILAAPIALLWFLSRGRWIGLGDAKLALGIGWLLGLSSGIAVLILAVWTGALYSISVLGLSLVGRVRLDSPLRSREGEASKSKRVQRRLFPRMKTFTMKSEIPFAPFLILSTLLVFLYEISFTDIQSLLNKFLS